MPLSLQCVCKHKTHVCVCVRVCVSVSQGSVLGQETLQIAQVSDTVCEIMCSSPFAPLMFALLTIFDGGFPQTLIQFTKQLYFIRFFLQVHNVKS